MACWRALACASIPLQGALRACCAPTWHRRGPAGRPCRPRRAGHTRGGRQVALKFVPAVCAGVLAVVDQHAADERVCLERLRAEVAPRPAQQRCAERCSSEPIFSRSPCPLPRVRSSGGFAGCAAHGDSSAWAPRSSRRMSARHRMRRTAPGRAGARGRPAHERRGRRERCIARRAQALGADNLPARPASERLARPARLELGPRDLQARRPKPAAPLPLRMAWRGAVSTPSFWRSPHGPCTAWS
jgi:hypothetical protein